MARVPVVLPRRMLAVACALLVLCAASGCRAQEVVVAQAAPATEPKPDVNPKLTTANTQFGFALFAELRNGEPEHNVFISPTSIATALAMTYNGAAGETKTAMAKALSLGDLSLQESNQAHADLRQALERTEPGIELHTANSLWVRQGCAFEQPFLQANQDCYGAKLAEMDFSRPGAADTINAWVREATKDRIEDIVESPLDPMTVLILINATYFKGDWQHPFEKRHTQDGPFTLPDGSQKPVPMMSQMEDFAYLRGKGFQAVSLPYGKGDMSMYVFLPDQGSSLAAFCGSLNAAENWDAWMKEFHSTQVELKLPRFTLRYDTVLNAALSALGMGIAFDSRKADFSNMGPPPLWISKVRHKAFVQVDEKGTEAAAATAVQMVGAAAPAAIVPFVVDRPFFWAIRDHDTGAVLFMGVVVDPAEERV